MSVRSRYYKKRLTLKSGRLRKYITVYNYLPGETIAWEAYTKKHIKLLGQNLACMHKILQTPAADSVSRFIAAQTTIYDELHALLQRIEAYFLDKNVQKALQAKLTVNTRISFKLLHACVDASKSLSAQHVLHMDFVRSNVLFSQDAGQLQVSGIIDFEKVSYGSPLFDIARTLAFLLVDCKHKSTEEIKKYFLASGYVKHGDGSIPSMNVRTKDGREQLLAIYVRLFLLHDFYKFLLHNPYESLAENEHYRRTRDILIEKKMLEYTI